MPLDSPQTFASPAACRTFLNDKLTTLSFLGNEHVYFRGKDCIAQVSTKENIETIIRSDASLGSISSASKTTLAADIVKRGPRMFAICTYGSVRMECLRLMLEQELTDENIPFDESDFKSNEYEDDFKRFRESQFISKANDPAWSALTKGSFSTPIGEDQPIPMRSGDELDAGVAAKVYTCTFDEMYDNDDKATDQKPEKAQEVSKATMSRKYAMKVFSDPVQAQRERNFAEFLKTKNIQHEHIVKFRFGFQYGDSYHLVSELAEKSLERHFANADHKAHDRPWLRLQIIGLVDALKKIHEPTEGTTAYHHDIKPANILVFGVDDKHRLKLADFGAAGFDEKYEPSVGSHKSGARGDAYLPPEHINDTPTSRPHDVWSLGCILVELCVRHVYGWFTEGATKSLHKLKLEISNYRKNDRKCWFIEAPLDDSASQAKGAAVPVAIHDKLLVLIQPAADILKDLRCKNTNMSRVVDVLRKMLHIDPESRITAADALAEFNAIPDDWAA